MQVLPEEVSPVHFKCTCFQVKDLHTWGRGYVSGVALLREGIHTQEETLIRHGCHSYKETGVLQQSLVAVHMKKCHFALHLPRDDCHKGHVPVSSHETSQVRSLQSLWLHHTFYISWCHLCNMCRQCHSYQLVSPVQHVPSVSFVSVGVTCATCAVSVICISWCHLCNMCRQCHCISWCHLCNMCRQCHLYQLVSPVQHVPSVSFVPVGVTCATCAVSVICISWCHLCNMSHQCHLYQLSRLVYQYLLHSIVDQSELSKQPLNYPPTTAVN